MVAAGMEVEARDADQQIPLHLAAWSDLTQSAEVMRELILQHNANMFAVDNHGRTPSNAGTVMVHSTRFVLNPLHEIYGNKLRQEEDGPLFHSILLSAEYAYVEGLGFHPPLSLNNLQIHIPLGKLVFQHFRILLQYLGTDLIRNRDASGKLPIHTIAEVRLYFSSMTRLRFSLPTTVVPFLCTSAAMKGRSMNVCGSL